MLPMNNINIRSRQTDDTCTAGWDVPQDRQRQQHQERRDASNFFRAYFFVDGLNCSINSSPLLRYSSDFFPFFSTVNASSPYAWARRTVYLPVESREYSLHNHKSSCSVITLIIPAIFHLDSYEHLHTLDTEYMRFFRVNLLFVF